MNNSSSSVSFTAKVMAAARALESMRSDALFYDPLAAKLAGEDAIEKARPIVEKNIQENSPYLQVRTRFLDDFLLAHADDIRQVVMLGAGLDTRAFRMNLSADTHLYEVDQQDVFAYKNPILEGDQPSCIRHVIAGDISQPEWSESLLQKGFQPDQPSLWIAEGLLYYLTEAAVRALMVIIQSLTPEGSCFAGDMMNDVVCNGEDEWAKYWHWGCNDPVSFLGRYGWQAQAVQPGEGEALFGAYTFQLPPQEEIDKPHIFLFTAVKKGM